MAPHVAPPSYTCNPKSLVWYWLSPSIISPLRPGPLPFPQFHVSLQGCNIPYHTTTPPPHYPHTSFTLPHLQSEVICLVLVVPVHGLKLDVLGKGFLAVAAALDVQLEAREARGGRSDPSIGFKVRGRLASNPHDNTPTLVFTSTIPR